MSELVERLREGVNGQAENFAMRNEAAARIEQLEAALRKIACKHVTEQPLWWQLEARAALDQSPPPVRQENDDVFKGFRGNNEA
jgi:hypothetical protein